VGWRSEEGRGGPGGVGLGWLAVQGLGRGKGSGSARVEGEAGRGWAKSGAEPEFKKKLFSKFN
jgi:hypothetical protein